MIPIVKPYRPTKIKVSPTYKNLFRNGGNELPVVKPSKLKMLLMTNPTTAPMVGGIDKIKKNIAENLGPYGYDHAIRRIGAAAIGRKSPMRDEVESTMSDSSKERIDLLNMLLNRPQKYNSMPLSDFSPSNSKDKNKRYYKSPITEAYLSEAIRSNPTRSQKLQRESLSLGEYKTELGQDDKGKYVSYYDKWDLNPIPRTGIKWLDKTVDSVVTGLPNALGITNTPEVYGRIYLDPKTGKPTEKRYGGNLPIIKVKYK